MTRINPYKKGSKISVLKTKKIIKYFGIDINSIKTFEILGINRKNTDIWFINSLVHSDGWSKYIKFIQRIIKIIKKI